MTRFQVELDEFTGPFDALLSLITKHKLELTELALHQVTDEFCAYVRAQGPALDLDEASGFVVVAATLLDLKAARLLPQGEVESEDDLALLEARDLLFARLLQYRAFKSVALVFTELLELNRGVRPRDAGLDPDQRALAPDVDLDLSPTDFARLAAAALTPQPVPQVGIAHLHTPRYVVAEQAARVARILQRQRSATFRALVADARDTGLVVARFLAVLGLATRQFVALDQTEALGELRVRWTGPDGDLNAISFDDMQGEVLL